MADLTTDTPEMSMKEENSSTDLRSEWNLRSILALFGASLALFTTVGFVNAYGVFQEYYYRHLLSHKSEFDISWIGSFQAFALFIFAAPAGFLADKSGPFIPLSVGSVLTVIAVFMLSLCKEYYQFFLAQGLLCGAGMACIMIPSTATASRYFNKHRGLAMGIVAAGSSIGGVIWPIMMDQLLNKHGLSFGWTVRIVGFTMIPLVMIATLTVRLPVQVPTAAATNTAPTDAGANDDIEGGRKPTKDIANNTAFSEGKKPQEGRLAPLKNVTFMVFCLGLAIFNFGMFSPLFYIPAYAASLGMSTSLAFYLISILNGASLFGRVLPGIVSDRLGYFNILSVAALFSAIIAFCWTGATSVVGVIFWSMAYGFTSGTILSLQLACASQLTSEETRGTALGTVMGAAALTGLVGLPICGRLIPHGFLSLSMYAGSMLLAGSVLIIYSRLRQSRKLFVKV